MYGWAEIPLLRKRVLHAATAYSLPPLGARGCRGAISRKPPPHQSETDLINQQTRFVFRSRILRQKCSAAPTSACAQGETGDALFLKARKYPQKPRVPTIKWLHKKYPNALVLFMLEVSVS